MSATKRGNTNLPTQQRDRNMYFLNMSVDLDCATLGFYTGLFASRYQAKKRAKFITRRAVEAETLSIRPCRQSDLLLTGWSVETYRPNPTLAALYDHVGQS